MEIFDQEFTTEVCDQLFGCFIESRFEGTVPGGKPIYYHYCKLCEKEIDIKNWVWAPHDEECIIPKVREYLKIYKPISVPEKKI